jgi:hypothetical protein
MTAIEKRAVAWGWVPKGSQPTPSSDEICAPNMVG